MELCSGGDLYGRLPYSEKQAAGIVTKLLSAIKYMVREMGPLLGQRLLLDESDPFPAGLLAARSWNCAS